jgi:hypothetical protein
MPWNESVIIQESKKKKKCNSIIIFIYSFFFVAKIKDLLFHENSLVYVF